MRRIDHEFPEYQWKQNKGYPTKKHREAIRKFGVCSHHRKSFQLLQKQFEFPFSIRVQLSAELSTIQLIRFLIVSLGKKRVLYFSNFVYQNGVTITFRKNSSNGKIIGQVKLDKDKNPDIWTEGYDGQKVTAIKIPQIEGSFDLYISAKTSEKIKKSDLFSRFSFDKDREICIHRKISSAELRASGGE